MRSAFLTVPILILLLDQSTAFAQDFSSRLREGAPCYSCGFKSGGQSLPLLSLPASLERQQEVVNRSLGGISGSSFQTQTATAEQTRRQLLKAPPQPAFDTGPPIQTEQTPTFVQPQLSADRFTFQRSFEERFNTGTGDSEEAFRLFTPKAQDTIQFLGGRRKRGLLKDLLSPDLNF